MLKAADPSIWVVGCQPVASDVMRQSVAAGCVVEAESGETLSDATAGELEAIVSICTATYAAAKTLHQLLGEGLCGGSEGAM